MTRAVWIRGLWSVGMLIWYFVFLRKVRVDRNESAKLVGVAMVTGLGGGLWSGGYSSTGAFIGVLAGGLGWMLWRGRLREDWQAVVDAASYALPFAWIFVRLGCVVEHVHAGLPSSSWLAVEYPGGPRWDLALLEMMWAAALSGVFLVWRNCRFGVAMPLTLGLFRAAIIPISVNAFYASPVLLLGWSVFVALVGLPRGSKRIS